MRCGIRYSLIVVGGSLNGQGRIWMDGFQQSALDEEGKWKLVNIRNSGFEEGSDISYAESFMSFIEHYKLGEVMRQPTAGTNGNINPFTLPGGYHISWTGMKVLNRDGSRHHLIGIQPTVPVKRTIQGVARVRDEFFEKALEVVQ